jgi:hypothetical protein
MAYYKVPSQNISERTEEDHKNVRIPSLLVDIRTLDLPLLLPPKYEARI